MHNVKHCHGCELLIVQGTCTYNTKSIFTQHACMKVMIYTIRERGLAGKVGFIIMQCNMYIHTSFVTLLSLIMHVNIQASTTPYLCKLRKGMIHGSIL